MAHAVGNMINGGMNLRPADEKKQFIGMLGGIHANKFPRPDLSKWIAYKCEPGQAKGHPQRDLIRPIQEEEHVDEIMQVPEAIAILFNSLPKRSQYNGNV
jgi:hypothetical protein